MVLLVYVTVAIHSVVSAFTHYTRLPGTYTWSGAKQACEDYGTDLATIKDDKDNSMFASACPNICWIGYTTQNNCIGCWYWLGQHTSTYTNWQSGNPLDSYDECVYY
eukprot:248927_1